MESERIELKPCPFCGGKAETIHAKNSVYIHCTQCSAMMGRYGKAVSALQGKLSFDTKLDAVEAWNRRIYE